VTINRPSRRNAFTPDTVSELLKAFADARDDATIGVGPAPRGQPAARRQVRLLRRRRPEDPRRQKGGYVGKDGVPRLNVLDLKRLIRSMPKVVIALVAGYAIGGGHVLHVHLRPHHRRRQRGLRPDRPEGRQLRRRFRRLLPRPHRRPEEGPRNPGTSAANTTPEQAFEMGLVNTVVPYEQLDAEGVKWAQRSSPRARSPSAA
jgi:naphthoate synthase